MIRKVLLTAAVVGVVMVSLGPNVGGGSARAADYGGNTIVGQQSGVIWSGDCSTAAAIALGGQMRITGDAARFRLQIVAYVASPNGTYANVRSDLAFVNPVGVSQQTWTFTLPSSYPGGDFSQSLPVGTGRCLIWFFLDPTGPYPNPGAVLSFIQTKVRLFPRTGGGGGLPSSSDAPGSSPSQAAGPPTPTPSPSAPPSHMCHASGTVQFGGSWVMTVNDGWLAVTGGSGGTAPSCPYVARAGDVPNVRLKTGRGWMAAWAFSYTGGWSGASPWLASAYGSQDGLCWSAQDRSTVGTPAAYTGITQTLPVVVQITDGGSGWGCSSADNTSTWEMWVDVTTGPTGSGYPSAPPSASAAPSSDPFDGLPSQTPQPVPPQGGGGGNGGNGDICELHPGISACASWPPLPSGVDMCQAHPDALACVDVTAPPPSSQPDDGTPDNSMNSDGAPCASSDPSTKIGYVAPDEVDIFHANDPLDFIGKTLTALPRAVGNSFVWVWDTGVNAVVPDGDCLGTIVVGVPERLSSYAPIGYVFQAADEIGTAFTDVGGADFHPCADFDVIGSTVEMCVPDLSDAPGISTLRTLLLFALAFATLLVLWGLGAGAIGAPSPEG